MSDGGVCGSFVVDLLCFALLCDAFWRRVSSFRIVGGYSGWDMRVFGFCVFLCSCLSFFSFSLPVRFTARSGG